MLTPSAPRLSFNFPELTGQTQLCKQVLGAFCIGSLPVFVVSTGVPLICQFLAQADGDGVAFGFSVSVEPMIQMCLRTEGKDGGSGKPDMFPELSGRYQKMDQPVRLQGLFKMDINIQLPVTFSTPARGVTSDAHLQDR